jgi:hypothetical protein
LADGVVAVEGTHRQPVYDTSEVFVEGDKRAAWRVPILGVEGGWATIYPGAGLALAVLVAIAVCLPIPISALPLGGRGGCLARSGVGTRAFG